MIKKGTGIASFVYPIGLGLGANDTSVVIVTVNDDGSVSVLSGASELGQGSDDVVAMVVAEELGVLFEDVQVISADTGMTPFAGLSSGSRQTFVTGHAAQEAARNIKTSLLDVAAEMLGSTAEHISFRERKVYDSGRQTDITLADVGKFCFDHARRVTGMGSADITGGFPDLETGQGSPFVDFVYGTHIAEVEVDTVTGQVEVLRIIAVHDVGKTIHATSLEGQIEGGVSMGFGYAMMEEVLVSEGRLLTPSFAEFQIPTILDMPKVEPVILETPSQYGPFGARGVAEPPVVAVAPSICNAIFDAVGVRPRDLPITAEKMRALLKENGY